MSTNKRPGKEIFFNPVLEGGMTLFLIFFFATLFHSYARSEYKSGSLQYKRGVFCGVTGKSLPLDVEINNYFVSGRAVGMYFSDSAHAGIGLEKSIWFLSRTKGLNINSAGNLEWFKNTYGISDPIPQSILQASKEVKDVRFSSEEMSALAQALEGKGGAPEWYETFSNIPPWVNWWVFFFVIQSGAFFAYFVRSLSREFVWYRFPWNTWWPYFGILLLMPGALPVMALCGGFESIFRGAARAKEYMSRAPRNHLHEADVLIATARDRMAKLQKRVGR